MSETPLLYLVRHGETDSNLATPFAGWSDDRLNDRGRNQAEALAERLAPEGVERVFSSPVRRCVETAAILAEALEADVRTVHGLHEIAVGVWKGLTEEEVRERWPEAYRAWLEAPDTFQLDGREPLEEVRARAMEATDQVGRAMLPAPDGPAVLVTHLAVIRVLWLHAQGRPLSDYHRIGGPHCEVFPLRWLARGKLESAGPAPAGA